MNKQSISFKADEQKLIKTGGIGHYASNIVAYIEATFDLGANWSGYDSVRAVWSNDYLTDISTVLDSNGKCIVPTEVLTDTGNVTVNLVGSIADGDTLTDRLTTYPCKAVIVDADAKVEGDETESITPSQFEQFVEIVHDEVEQVTGMTAEAETLPAGSDATASYSDGVLSLGIPKGDKGEQGEQGETGHTGEPAGFGNVTASVDNTVGTPSVVVNTSGPDTAKEFDFEFHNLKGDKGDTGETGATGNGIASTVLNPDYTLTITFTDGTSYTTPSIRGAKGDTGNTGATGNGIQSTVLNADYTLTITFTDGTSYTTPSIRGEQGPAGPVSDVTVNGTSVVDQNGVAKILMPELIKTVNGNPIVIDDAFGEVKNLDVELLPIQDLHGYSKPWSAGAGKNILPPNATDGTQTVSGVTCTATNGVYKIQGTPTAAVHLNYQLAKSVELSPSTNKIFFNNSTANGNVYLYFRRGTDTVHYWGMNTANREASGWSDTGNEVVDNIDIYIYASAGAIDMTISPMLTKLAETDGSFAPYTNICPITGHDSVTVGVTGKNLFDTSNAPTLMPCYDSGGTSQTRKGYILNLPSGNYVGSVSWTGATGGTYIYGNVIDGNGGFVRFFYIVAGSTLYTPTITLADGEHIVIYDVQAGTQAYPDKFDRVNIQIEHSSTPTDFAPYHGQSKTVTLPHTVYGAGVGATSGESKETWANIPSYNGETITEPWLSSMDEYVQGATPTTGAQVTYKLATPTDLSTTPTDITLYNGDNVISSDGEQTLTYVQDMAIVIRKIENQL